MKKVFQTKLKSITKVLTLVIIASLATFTGCKSYDEDINSLNTDVTALKSQLASLDTYTKAQIDAKITTLNGEITTLKTSLATLTANGATDAELAALKTDIESRFVTKAALDAYKTQVTTDIAAAVAGLATKASVDAVNVEVVKVQTALSALGVSVDAKILALKTELNAKDAELATAIGAVTARVATLEGLVAANTTGVAANKAAIVALQAELTALKNGTYTKAEIDAKLAALDADLKKLGTDLKLEFEVLATRQLSGLLFVPAWVNDGFNAVEVGYIVDIPTAPATSVKALFTQQNVTFRFNPTTADLTGTTWKFINNQATFNAPGLSAAPGDNNPLTPLFAAPALTNNNDGSGSFTLKVGTWSEPAAGKTNYFALQANKVVGAATSSVVSDYVKVTTTPYNAFISDAKKSVVSTDTYVHYRTAIPAIGATSDHELISDNSIVTDLDDLVLASANKGGVLEKTFAAYGFGVVGTDYKYEFSLPTYVGLDGITNQNSFVTLNAATNVLTVNQGSSVIDRNPLVKVDLKSMNGNLLATAYIKFKIVAKIVQPTTVTYNVAAVNLTYPSLFKGQAAIADNKTDIVLTWADINNYIYNPLGMKHNDFQAKFGAVTPTVAVTVNGTAVAGATFAQYPLIKSMLQPDVDTYAMKYQVTPLAKFGTTVVTYTFDTGVATDSKVKISFTYTVAKPTLDKTILAAYQYPLGNTTNVMTQGMNTPGSGYQMQLYLGEAFSYGSAAYRNVFGSATPGKIDGATHQFVQTTVPAIAGASLSVTAPASIDVALGTTNSTGTLMKLTSPLVEENKVYPMNFKTIYPNGEVDDFFYNVNFKNPFSIVLSTPNNFTLTDLANGAAFTLDMKDNYTVMFKGTKRIVTNGNPEIADSETTVKASDYITVPLAPGALNYTFATLQGDPYPGSLTQPDGAGTSKLKWDNGGTQLSFTQVGTIKVKFTTPFAVITRDADNVYVKPE